MKTKIKEKTNKKGISLIVLVITIIVMIILAAAVIISLSNNGIIGKANEAVEQTNLKQVQTVAQTLWAEGQLTKDDPATIKNKIIAAIGGEGVASEYDIDVDENGVTVNIKNEVSNGPTLTITSTASKDINNPTIVNTATYTVSGTVLGDTGIKDVTVKYPGEGINKATVIPWQDIAQDGSWSTTINLIKDEVMPITIVATDAKNNTTTEVRYVCYTDDVSDDNLSSGTYYLYNGVELPDINEVWDKETYPYAIMTFADCGAIDESLSGHKVWYLKLFSNQICAENGTLKIYASNDILFKDFNTFDEATLKALENLQGVSSGLEPFTWIEGSYGNHGNNVTLGANQYFWTSHDILNEDGTVYLAASTPVPVED